MSNAPLTLRIDPDLKDQLRAYASRRNATMSAVAETAIEEDRAPQAYRNLSLKYLSRLDRKYSKALKRMDLTLETLGTLVRVWFRRHPRPEDPDVREEMKRQGERFYELFVELVQRNIEADKTFQRAFEERLFTDEDFRPASHTED